MKRDRRIEREIDRNRMAAKNPKLRLNQKATTPASSLTMHIAKQNKRANKPTLPKLKFMDDWP